MFFVKSGGGLGSVRELLPGVVALSILFGSTSVLAITITFEKKARSFERLLLAPVTLEVLMLAKTSGAILFGMAGAFVPVAMAVFVADLSGIDWPAFFTATVLIAVVSTFLGLLIAVAVAEVFEAQTLSNFFRFPMMFLCGLFIPLDDLPELLRPLSYALPLTYGADILHGAVSHSTAMPQGLSFGTLLAFCVGLFWLSLRQVRRRWIV
jgi:ABC-2 type transport system permease protein